MLASPLSLPLLTLPIAERLIVAQDRAEERITVSLDLGRTTTIVEPRGDQWVCALGSFPYPFGLQERTIYRWSGSSFEPVRYVDGSCYELVPTHWGPPALAVDGVAVISGEFISPYEHARRRLMRLDLRGKRVLLCSDSLGYLAHWCLVQQAAAVMCIEQGAAAAWLSEVNPWSPRQERRLLTTCGDFEGQVSRVGPQAVDMVVVEVAPGPGASCLRPQQHYDQLARVMVDDGLLVHSLPVRHDSNQLPNLAEEIGRRLKSAGFTARLDGDALLAQRRARLLAEMQTPVAGAA